MRKVTISLLLSVIIMFACTGCDENQQLSLQFTPDSVGTYKVVQESTKEVRFEQPSLDKVKLDTVSSVTEMTFDQKVVSVDTAGAAQIDITIKSIKLYSKGKKGVNFDFDSSRKDDLKKPLAKLLGQTYKIKVDTSGKVSVVDTATALKVIKTREAKALLRNDIIVDRHSFKAMPESGVIMLSKNMDWSKVVSSPKGALEPKAFEKVYTVASLKKDGKNKVAKIQMEALPTEKKPVGGIQGTGKGLGMMAGIFDSSEQYVGEMAFDVTNKELLSYSEKLQSDYVAAEESSEGKSDQGPDVLTMSFISSYSIEKL